MARADALVEMFNFCLRGLSHCPMDDLVLFSHRLRWSSGAGDKPLTVHSWLKVDATFADAALLAAGGNAILQLAQRWAEGKGYGHSDQQAAALLWQVCSDRGDLPLTPLHDLPEPGPPDRKCSMLSTGTKPWASLRDAFRLLYSALVPYTPDLWDEAMRSLAAPPHQLFQFIAEHCRTEPFKPRSPARGLATVPKLPRRSGSF